VVFTCDITPLGGGLTEGSTLVVMSIRVNVITFNVNVLQSRGP